MKLFWSLALLGLSAKHSSAADLPECTNLITPGEPLVYTLDAGEMVTFAGVVPKITRFQGEPMIKIMAYSHLPVLDFMSTSRILTVPTQQCAAASTSAPTLGSGAFQRGSSLFGLATSCLMYLGGASPTTSVGMGLLTGFAGMAPIAQAQLTSECIPVVVSLIVCLFSESRPYYKL